ncbi:C39 family peptidase [Nocardioides panacis]|uniref:C39 family peptidase n=1 Tax=Nocardioides panacis TaxID=2849501 RepID=A0A975SZM8_9ACTN|nr:C39 family peptidase [Nocardioides panacis]QWZ08163.1 C39 family peptidase [Nocardioides panacis]
MTLTAVAARHVTFTAWRGPAGLAAGSHLGTVVEDGRLAWGAAAGTFTYADPYGAEPPAPVGYEWAAWVSPEVECDFGATELVPSWNAETPGDSWLLVEARTATGHDAAGRRWTRWFSLALWADSDREIHPTSVPGQAEEAARVETDVLAADGFTAFQLRVSLARRPGSTARPTVRMVGAMASRVPEDAPEDVSPGGLAWGVELPVPPYSQQLHRGEYLHWDRGGQSWCSPTSMSMLLAFHDRLPEPSDYAWVEPLIPDPFVVQAARHVFDYAYEGAGNWSFNTAYAGRHGADAFVTRLRSLTEAERFIAAGVPLAATVSFTRETLPCAGYATEGHLLTIIGFDEVGDVICNDPASHILPSNDEVRVVFDRGRFERAWLGSSGGVVYVVHTDAVPLPAPADPAEPNW